MPWREIPQKTQTKKPDSTTANKNRTGAEHSKRGRFGANAKKIQASTRSETAHQEATTTPHEATQQQATTKGASRPREQGEHQGAAPQAAKRPEVTGRHEARTTAMIKR
jgi:hypothetical protein